jgi:multisubunit Na+/H+ antiporter MnhE subunit
VRSLSVNLLVATIWLLLSSEPSPAVFALGFLIGFVLLATFQRVVPSADYVRRCVALLRFLLVFAWEFLLANAKVAWAVLFRSRASFHPNFITYDISGLTPSEILLLSYCITLTPGTCTVDVTRDFRTLVFHSLDANDPDGLRAEIDTKLVRGILSFTR